MKEAIRGNILSVVKMVIHLILMQKYAFISRVIREIRLLLATLSLALLFSLLGSGHSFALSDKAVYRVKGVVYFQSDSDSMAMQLMSTKRCLNKKMLLESYLNLSRFSSLAAKKNRQTLELAKLIQFSSLLNSKEKDVFLSKKYKKCLKTNNYALLAAEEFLAGKKNLSSLKAEVNRSLTHTFFNQSLTPELWKKK